MTSLADRLTAAGFPPVWEGDPMHPPMLEHEAHWLLTGYGFTEAQATTAIGEMRAAGQDLTGPNITAWVHEPEHARIRLANNIT